MRKLFESEDLGFVAAVAAALKQIKPPEYGSEQVEARVEFFFEDEPLGLKVRLDGAGESYLVEVFE